MRQLIVILGDQLDLESVLPDDFDPGQDALWMAESGVEAHRVYSHKARIALFLSAMRHFAGKLRADKLPIIYRQQADASLADILAADIRASQPGSVVITRPGDWHLWQTLKQAVDNSPAELMLREDPHFMTTPQAFREWSQGRKSMRMEHFYRVQRRAYNILVDEAGEPEGGRWNFDAENRGSFGKEGPPQSQPVASFEPDAMTRQVLDEVNQQYADNPGTLTAFDWPVTRAQALEEIGRAHV